MAPADRQPNGAELRRHLAGLDRYLRIATVSGAIDVGAIAAVQAFWAAEGLVLETIGPEDAAGTPSLLGRIAGPPGAPTLLLYGHYDVQPPGDLHRWVWHGSDCPPFVPSWFLDGTRLETLDPVADQDLGRLEVVARGVADNKAQHYAAIQAALEAARAGTARHHVLVMLEGEEESGSPNLVAIVRRHRDRLRADLCLCADAPKVDNRPTLVLGVRGIIHLHLSAANGQATGLHSGNYGNVVTNPALPLAALIERIAAAITRHAEAHDDFRRDALEQLIATDDPFLWPTTNINHLATEGTMLNARRLVIPRAAHAKIDVRLTPDTPPAAVASIAESLVEAHRRIHPALTFDLRVTDGKPASFTSPARPEYGWLHRLLADQGEGEVVVMPILGGTLPIWVFTDTLGIPTFVLPCANSDNQQHDASEHYIARHLPLQMGLFRRILDSLPDGSAAGAAMEASA